MPDYNEPSAVTQASIQKRATQAKTLVLTF